MTKNTYRKIFRSIYSATKTIAMESIDNAAEFFIDLVLKFQSKTTQMVMLKQPYRLTERGMGGDMSATMEWLLQIQ